MRRRRRSTGGTANGSATDAVDVDFDFEIFDEDIDGNAILDSDADPNASFFVNAVEQFIISLIAIEALNSDDILDGRKILVPFANLKAELVTSTNPLETSIVYTITDSNGQIIDFGDIVKTQLNLADNDPALPFLDATFNTKISTFRLPIINSSGQFINPLVDSNQDISDAINSLDFIIDNQIFNEVVQFDDDITTVNVSSQFAPNLIQGNALAESITGLNIDDDIFGLNGNDTIEGLDGFDSIFGGLGADSMLGGNDDDTILGNGGNDFLDGESGSDSLHGGTGNDTLIGGTSLIFSSEDPVDVLDDQSPIFSTININTDLTSISDVNVLVDISTTFTADLDVFLISPSGTRVELFTDVGGSGNNFSNTILNDEAGSSINSATAPFSGTFRPEGLLSDFDGEDPLGIWTLEITDDTSGNLAILHSWALGFSGIESEDTLVGALGNDSIVGGSGDDFIIWNDGDGNDTIDGGFDDDVVQVNGDTLNGDNYEIIASGSTIQMSRTNLSSFTLDIDNVEVMAVNGGGGNDTLTVQDLSGTGVDRVAFATGDGNDSLNATSAKIKIISFGGAGNDTLRGNNSTGVGDDLSGNTGDDFLYGNLGDDLLDGGTGNDNLFGLVGNDTLIGGSGNDILDGGSGIDRMEGGSGNDIFYVNQLGELVIESLNQGRDRVLSSISFTLPANLEDLTLTGNLNRNGFGNGLANNILGNSGNNFFIGQGGNDVINGLDGNDFFFGNDGADRLIGSGGNDILNGNAGNDIIYGNDGDDRLNGQNDNDSLIGGNGKDVLIGGAGNDTLTGGFGADSFRFNSRNEGVDTITDYSVPADTFIIRQVGFGGGLPLGTLSASRFHIGAVAADASDRFVYNQTNGRLYFDRDGAGGFAQQLIAKLDSGLNLSRADFLVIA